MSHFPPTNPFRRAAPPAPASTCTADTETVGVNTPESTVMGDPSREGDFREGSRLLQLAIDGIRADQLPGHAAIPYLALAQEHFNSAWQSIGTTEDQPTAIGIPDLKDIVAEGQSSMSFQRRHLVKGTEMNLPTVDHDTWQDLQNKADDAGPLMSPIKGLLDYHLDRGCSDPDELKRQAFEVVGLYAGVVGTIPDVIPNTWNTVRELDGETVAVVHGKAIQSAGRAFSQAWDKLTSDFAAAKSSDVQDSTLTNSRDGPGQPLRYVKGPNAAKVKAVWQSEQDVYEAMSKLSRILGHPETTSIVREWRYEESDDATEMGCWYEQSEDGMDVEAASAKVPGAGAHDRASTPTEICLPDLDDVVATGQSTASFQRRHLEKRTGQNRPRIHRKSWQDLLTMHDSRKGMERTRELIDLHLGRECSSDPATVQEEAAEALGLYLGLADTVPERIPAAWPIVPREDAAQIQSASASVRESWATLQEAIASAKKRGVPDSTLTNSRTAEGKLRFVKGPNATQVTKVWRSEQNVTAALTKLSNILVDAKSVFNVEDVEVDRHVAYLEG